MKTAKASSDATTAMPNETCEERKVSPCQLNWGLNNGTTYPDMTAGRTRAATGSVRSAITTGGATRTSGRCRVPVYSRRGTRSGRPRSSPRGRGRGAYIPHGSTRGADGEIGPDRQAGIEIRIRGFQIAEARAIGGVEDLGLVGGCGIAEAGCLAPPQPDVVEARRRGFARG